jgi:hypothetical protein
MDTDTEKHQGFALLATFEVGTVLCNPPFRRKVITQLFYITDNVKFVHAVRPQSFSNNTKTHPHLMKRLEDVNINTKAK